MRANLVSNRVGVKVDGGRLFFTACFRKEIRFSVQKPKVPTYLMKIRRAYQGNPEFFFRSILDESSVM